MCDVPSQPSSWLMAHKRLPKKNPACPANRTRGCAKTGAIGPRPLPAAAKEAAAPSSPLPGIQIDRERTGVHGKPGKGQGRMRYVPL